MMAPLVRYIGSNGGGRLETSFTRRSRSRRIRLVSSAVLFAAPRRRPRLTPLHLRDTASILAPQWRHVAPCLGAALSGSPVVGNLMRLGDRAGAGHSLSSTLLSSSSSSSSLLECHRAASLASLVFFQLLRESPLHLSRSKSLPAAYLTPSLVGTLLGVSRHHHHQTSVWQILRDRHGIKSNYVDHTHWTGVSLTRWRDLLPPTSDDNDNDNAVVTRNRIPSNSNSTSNSTASSLVPAVWLVALWESSTTKGDLLDYLIALNDVMVSQQGGGATNTSIIFNPHNPLAQALLHDPTARADWEAEEWDASLAPSSLSSSSVVQSALDRLLWDQTRSKGGDSETSGSSSGSGEPMDDEWAQALEVVCTGMAQQQSYSGGKAACPNGYYSYDGGDLKADCAELAAREIMDLLLWDHGQERFDVGRLPTTASPRLVQFYEEQGGQSVAHHHQGDEDSLGNEWFQLMSNLPGCDYLATSPSGKTYELGPTIANMVRALQHLLLVGDTTAAATRTVPWNSLEDLARAWNSSSSSSRGSHTQRPPLVVVVDEQRLTHRSAETEVLMHHEVVTLQLQGEASAIEIRLRCNWEAQSGMAAVAHLRQREPLVDTAQLEQLWSLIRRGNHHPALQTLGLALLGDLPLQQQRQQHFTKDEGTTHADLATLAVLAAPYGCDRRGLFAADVPDSYHDAILVESEQVLLSALQQTCFMSHSDEHLAALLLPWLLSEGTTVNDGKAPFRPKEYNSELESSIMSLPESLLGNGALQDALEDNHWAIRGKPLAAWARWKSGSASLFQSASSLSVHDMSTFASFARSK